MTETSPQAEPLARREVNARPRGTRGEPARIVVDEGECELTNPRFGARDHAHGDEAVLIVDAPASLEGRTVRFQVEHLVGGDWQALAEATATVEGGTATARVRVEHEAEAARTELHFAQDADLGARTIRFHAAVEGET